MRAAVLALGRLAFCAAAAAAQQRPLGVVDMVEPHALSDPQLSQDAARTLFVNAPSITPSPITRCRRRADANAAYEPYFDDTMARQELLTWRGLS